MPVYERDLPGDVHAVELSPPAAPDVDELRSDTPGARFRHSAERRAFVPSLPALDVRLLEAPRVDWHGLLDHVRQAGAPQLVCDELGGGAFLGRSRDAKAQRM